MPDLTSEGAALLIADVLGVDVGDVRRYDHGARYDQPDDGHGVAVSIQLWAWGCPKIRVGYGTIAVIIEESPDVRADLKCAVSAVRSLAGLDEDEIGRLRARVADLERERDEARALVDTLDARLVSDGSEVIRLRAELAKPVLGPWLHDPNDALCPWSRWSVDGGIIAAVDVLGWSVRHLDGSGRSSGLATGDEGKAAADAAARAFGWRLVDGGEVRDA